jgi:signal peptidase I
LTVIAGITLLPAWIGGYSVVGRLGAYQLGYVPENTTIVGTGSMYPTWPKGDIGKTPAELVKQIVGTAGFLRYPNGLVLAGQRLFGHQIGRGDIIIFHNQATDDLNKKVSGVAAGLMKRVIALSGDTIELRDGLVYLNNKPIKEQYVAKPRTTFGEAFLKECQKVTVPENSVFAMGDNRMGSADSREIGFVPISDINYVLPYGDQKGKLDKNWHDTTNDLDNSSKLKIDRNQFVELLNVKRKENGASPIKYNTKLEKSAELRGKAILKFDDYSYEATSSGYTMEKSMADARYWNSYWWEVIIPGYYDAGGLIENYLDRDTSDAKKNWFDKKFQDIGIAEVEGNVNGCPTQVIVIQVAGYIPATYNPKDVQSWRDALNNLNNIIPSWENAKGKGWMNEQDLAHLLDLLYRERIIASNILAKEEARQWLSKADSDSIEEYNGLANESSALANRLNGK